MIEALYLLAAGVWRLIDGSSVRPKLYNNIVNVSLLALLTYTGALYATGDTWVSLWVALWACLNILTGFKGWEDWGYMSLRFAGPAAIAVLPLSVPTHHALLYVFACFAAGVMYPALLNLHDNVFKLPKFWLVDGPEAYARTISGATIIGGLTFI